MVPTPIALGLTLCEKVVVEEGTHNITLVNCFSEIKVSTFPYRPAPFFVIATLTNSQGTGKIELLLTRLDTDEKIERWQSSGTFANRFAAVRVRFRISGCSFPASGRYQFLLLVDDEWVAQRDLEIVRK